MSEVAGAYCATEDLRLGDIRPVRPAEQYVLGAAEEIDAALGAIYLTPIVIPAQAKYRPAKLTLKKINYLLASGRAILDMAASGENANQHAYGMGMLKEGLAMLKTLVEHEVTLDGASLIEGGEAAVAATGPSIMNEDPESLVESFYQRGSELFPTPYSRPYAQPYGIQPRRSW